MLPFSFSFSPIFLSLSLYPAFSIFLALSGQYLLSLTYSDESSMGS